MRHGRAKAARKTLQHFGRTIGLQAPYWVLMDGTLVAALFQHKISPIRERVDRVLQTTGAAGPNKYCITQAAVDELQMVYQDLEAKQHSQAEAFQQALEWIRKECIVLSREKEGGEEGDKDPVDSSDKKISENAASTTPAQTDLLYHIQNDERPCIVATQDESMLQALRWMGTVPIVRLANNSVLLLEQPSKKSQSQFQGLERRKWKHSLPDSERALVNLVKKEQKATKKNSEGPPQRQQRVKAKAKGPNPLSCKRKELPEKSKESASKKRRTRDKKPKTES
jgi:rRNA-processing protein FCF1